MTTEQQVNVGIVSGDCLSFAFSSPYLCGDEQVVGAQRVVAIGGRISWRGSEYDELTFVPTTSDASFSIDDVVIGVHFHWERRERQTFLGELRLVMDGDRIQLINRLPVERYLESVISSEMSATSSLELLKAHAVISRSWLIHLMRKGERGARSDSSLKSSEEFLMSSGEREVRSENSLENEADNQVLSHSSLPTPHSSLNNIHSPKDTPRTTHIKWYDHEDHRLFDVCADDHCQRYQGITRAANPHVREAVRATEGEVLTYDGEICDARFSKCCGGATEEFRYCWEDEDKPYLKAVSDTPDGHSADLSNEADAERWIRTAPDAFCNTDDRRVLRQVLNDYDQETPDFYRWRVEYSQQELSALIGRKLGVDVGDVIDLKPLRRGRSGRICLLRIEGSSQTIDVGKELEIRRTLSESHLYSSAFVVDKEYDGGTVPSRFILTGAGWGHGVGLCQIGAAVMGERGYSYREILSHYYPGAEIKKTDYQNTKQI